MGGGDDYMDFNDKKRCPSLPRLCVQNVLDSLWRYTGHCIGHYTDHFSLV